MSKPHGSIRRFFPGGNTSLGFFSYYDQIIKVDAAHIFIIKGGPGVGKSTFMKEIGEVMLKQGYDLEHHHCSSDNNSLDGLVIPELEVALIDGTAPHIVDPKNPGAVDELLNLGEFWDEAEIKKSKDRIIEINKEIGDCFNRAYKYLKAAGEVYSDLIKITEKRVRLGSLYKLMTELREKVFVTTKTTDFPSGLRKLFASAITPDGPVNYLDTIFKPQTREYVDKNLFILEGPPGGGKEVILESLINSAVEKGLNAEVFYCPLLPKKAEHLWLPELKTGVISSHWPHKYSAHKDAEVIDTTPLLKPLDGLKLEASREDKLVFDDLLERAVGWIKKAKYLHDKLEEYYIPNMNFDGIEDLRVKTVQRILSLNKQDTRVQA